MGADAPASGGASGNSAFVSGTAGPVPPAARAGSAPEPPGPAAHRVLGPAQLVALGLGGIIGAGIFVTIGVAAHDKAGPAVVISFLVAAVACIAVALCYCECASAVPVAGSAYAYAREAVGEAGAWITGWLLVTVYLLAGAAVAQGWSGYFRSLLAVAGVEWPRTVGGAPIDLDPLTGRLVSTGALLDMPALLALGAIAYVVYRGIRLSLRFNNLVLIAKLTLLAFVVAIGLTHANPANWSPFAPFGYGGFTIGALGSGSGNAAAATTGMLAGAPIAFFAFGGFEMLSTYSHECRKPRRDVPIGVIVTVGLLTLVYVAVAAALTGLVRYDRISVTAPLSDAFRAVGMPGAQFLVALGAVASMSTVLLAVVMSLPRVLMAIGGDGLIPPGVLDYVHPRFRTPSRSVVLVASAAGVLGALLPLRLIMDVVMMASLAGYIAVCVFAVILRQRTAGRNDLFRAPLGPAAPAVGVAACLLLMLAMPGADWLRLAAWCGLGAAVYGALAVRRRSTAGARLAAPAAAGAAE